MFSFSTTVQSTYRHTYWFHSYYYYCPAHYDDCYITILLFLLLLLAYFHIALFPMYVCMYVHSCPRSRTLA